MLSALLLAGLTLQSIDLGAEVHQVRVVDLDNDGFEDVVAVTAKELFIFRGTKHGLRKQPVTRILAPAVTVVGKGLCGFVINGYYHAVPDPMGDASKHGPAGARCLLGALGAGLPALLDSPGDVDGDGIDDAVLPDLDGFHVNGKLVPLPARSSIEILRNETFAIKYEIAVPVAGNWSGAGGELVFFEDKQILVYKGPKLVERIALHDEEAGAKATALRRTQILMADVDGDGRLDLLITPSWGKAGIFASFDTHAWLWLKGHVWNKEKNGLYPPASAIKVAGALIRPDLLDVDSDGDLDLVLCTIDMGVVGLATGSAPGLYQVYLFDGKRFKAPAAWTYKGKIGSDALMNLDPQPPVTFLPDLDGDGRPEAVERGNGVRLLIGDGEGKLVQAARLDVQLNTGSKPDGTSLGRVRSGKQRAAIPARTGIVFVEAVQ